MRVLVIVVGLVIAVLGGGVAAAQTEPTATPVEPAPAGAQISDDQVNRVARQLYCPICENVPLDVCETQACEDWKDEIRQRLAAGQSEQEIIDYFASVYGERALAEPRSWVVWVLPVVGLVIAGLIFLVVVRNWTRNRPEPAPARTEAVEPMPLPPGLDEGDAEYVARLEREIREQ